MRRILAFTLSLLFPVLNFAHQAEISTTMLIEKQGKWILQINGALNAFDYELKVQHGDSAYASPEEFQALVATMVQNRLSVSFDGQEISWGDSQVKIGHETSVVMVMNDIPNEYTLISVSNELFTDIRKSKSALVVLKEGAEIERFEMNKSNDYKVDLILSDKGFVQINNKIASMEEPNYRMMMLFPILILILVFAHSVWKRIKMKQGVSAGLS